MIFQERVWNSHSVTLILFEATPFWQTWWFNILTLIVLIFIAYLFNKIRITQSEEAREKQQKFAKQLINAQEIERQRIAAELHDSIGQDLLIIKNRALLGLNQKSNQKLTREQLDEISATASRALDETRAIARNLRPLHLQRLGLTQTLSSMIEQILKSAGISFKINIENIDYIFDSSDELSIFRIFQECLNNIVKHSETKEAKIEVSKSGEIVKISIEDTGKGFDVNSSDKIHNGFGLTSIEQRVKILGGAIKINSSIGVGTKIIISLNFQNEPKS